jgi:hypothetical protein
MARNITQLAVARGSVTPERLYALCDDGLVWMMYMGVRIVGGWSKLPALPSAGQPVSVSVVSGPTFDVVYVVHLDQTVWRLNNPNITTNQYLNPVATWVNLPSIPQ